MIKKIHVLLSKLDELFELPKGTSKIEVKKHLKIESLAPLSHEEKIYIIRYLDNIFLLNDIDIDENNR